MMERRKWYAIYTKPRWEKKVNMLLTQKGVESYCPLNKVTRQWTDRKKIIEEPLFKSYVFVRVSEEERTEVRMTQGVVNFVYWLGKPALIKDREITTIKKFLNEYAHLEVQPLQYAVDAKVVVEQGPFMHKEATVVKVMKKKLVIKIESIGYVLIAHVHSKNVSPIP